MHTTSIVLIDMFGHVIGLLRIVFTLVFCFPGNFNRFYVSLLPDFLISDVINLISPLAHLNILISAEFLLFSSFFFPAQHSEPYVIAYNVTVSFNSTASPYRTLTRILPYSSSTRLLSYCLHQHVNLPHP